MLLRSLREESYKIAKWKETLLLSWSSLYFWVNVYVLFFLMTMFGFYQYPSYKLLHYIAALNWLREQRLNLFLKQQKKLWVYNSSWWYIAIKNCLIVWIIMCFHHHYFFLLLLLLFVYLNHLQKSLFLLPSHLLNQRERKKLILKKRIFFIMLECALMIAFSHT